MSLGSRNGNRGSINFDIGEPFAGNPTLAPGFPRPVGWRVRAPDGSAAYDKIGPLDTDWIAVAARKLTSVDGSVTITDPTGPISDLSVPSSLAGLHAAVAATAPDAWYEADALVTVAGGLATTWGDKSGNHYDLTKAPLLFTVAPTFNPTGFNGLPSLTFGPTAQLAYLLSAVVPSGGPRTVLVGIKPSTSAGGAVLAFGTTSPGFGCLLYTRVGTQYGWGDDATFAATEGVDAFGSIVSYSGQPILAEWISDGATLAVNVNAANRPLAPNGIGADNGRGLQLGWASLRNDATLPGEYAFALVWARELSDAELAAARSYLALKWGLGVSPAGTGVQSVRAGTNITVDNSDPTNPIVTATAGGGGLTGHTTGTISTESGVATLEIADTDHCAIVLIGSASENFLDQIHLPTTKVREGDIITLINNTADVIVVRNYNAPAADADFGEIACAVGVGTLALINSGYGVATFRYSSVWGGTERTWFLVGAPAS